MQSFLILEDAVIVPLKAGHGAGKPTTKIIEEAADLWAFLVRTLGMAV
jgi:prolyl oligopeptidase